MLINRAADAFRQRGRWLSARLPMAFGKWFLSVCSVAFFYPMFMATCAGLLDCFFA
jgi:hypothetical protein